MRNTVKKIPGIRALYLNGVNLTLDLSWRGWGAFWQALGNLAPDMFLFNLWRIWCFWVAGVRFEDVATCVIRAGVFAEVPRNLKLGKGVQVNRGTYLGSNGPIVIEDDVRIGMNAQLITISHSGENYEVDEIQSIHLKKGAHIGAGSIILPGTVVEEGVMLAPGAVLGGATQSRGIYVGNPARLVSFRD